MSGVLAQQAGMGNGPTPKIRSDSEIRIFGACALCAEDSMRVLCEDVCQGTFSCVAVFMLRCCSVVDVDRPCVVSLGAVKWV